MIKEYKTILITGASSGLGKELAIQYAKSGITLCLISRNEKNLLETVSICENKGAKVLSKKIDIKDKNGMNEWISALNRLRNIDLVIANAGISAGTCNGVESKEQVYDIFETNIMGVLNTIEPIIPSMIKRKSGQIALISSMSSFIGMSSCPAYSSSKACITAYGEGLRGFLKQYNIGVSIVCPGFIKTPLTDKNKFYMPMIISAEKAAFKIIKGIQKNKGMIAFPFIIYLIMKFLRFLPFSWSNYIMSLLPKK